MSLKLNNNNVRAGESHEQTTTRRAPYITTTTTTLIWFGAGARPARRAALLRCRSTTFPRHLSLATDGGGPAGRVASRRREAGLGCSLPSLLRGVAARGAEGEEWRSAARRGGRPDAGRTPAEGTALAPTTAPPRVTVNLGRTKTESEEWRRRGGAASLARLARRAVPVSSRKRRRGRRRGGIAPSAAAPPESPAARRALTTPVGMATDSGYRTGYWTKVGEKKSSGPEI